MNTPKGYISQETARELLGAIIKCRVALTPHVFIDDDARNARNIADEAITKAEEELNG